jgi:hypothetical protein
MLPASAILISGCVIVLGENRFALSTIMPQSGIASFGLTPAQTPEFAARGASARGAVIVVHGLWMTGAVFAVQRAQLARSRILRRGSRSMRLHRGWRTL